MNTKKEKVAITSAVSVTVAALAFCWNVGKSVNGLENKLHGHDKDIQQMQSRIDRQDINQDKLKTSLEAWMLRIEAKLDRYLLKNKE